ncbi:uncharacterized protein TNCV_250471 [Trichonephila clavipes]|nr:uncharacterized protein TNCV_250471 [Trichonephila clavipes]
MATTSPNNRDLKVYIIDTTLTCPKFEIISIDELTKPKMNFPNCCILQLHLYDGICCRLSYHRIQLFPIKIQEKILADAGIDRDDIDVKLLVDFLIQRSPFPDTDAIISIATGITGDKDINCYDAFEQGWTVLKKTGQNLRELILPRKDYNL